MLDEKAGRSDRMACAHDARHMAAGTTGAQDVGRRMVGGQDGRMAGRHACRMARRQDGRPKV